MAAYRNQSAGSGLTGSNNASGQDLAMNSGGFVPNSNSNLEASAINSGAGGLGNTLIFVFVAIALAGFLSYGFSAALSSRSK